MALQSQTHANLQSCYYIRGADPIVPGDQAIIGPVEILPSDTSSLPAYYNRFNQTNATGLAISEFRTAGNELLSDIILNVNNSILLTSRRTGEEAVLEVGVNQAGDKGQVKLNADDGLIINNLAGAGKGLQIYHDGPTNQNILETVDGTGAKINFQGNTGLILVTNDVTADKIAITQNTDLVTIEKPGVGILSLTSGGVQFAGTTSSGRVGNFNGANVLLDSSTSVSIRTNTSGSTNTSITANTNGTVNFLSTITAPTGNISTVNSITANISTINNSTMNVTGNARIASVAVTNENTGSSVAYSTYYGNYQGNLRYNTIRDTAGAPATAIESLEIINVAGGPQTGGIQFYTANNGTPNLVKWMGGFLENNVGPQSEFRLASTTTASMPQLVNVSTINAISVLDLGNPVGTIISFAAWNPPAGYLRCDGQSYPIATYPRLYSVIGNTYGGTAPNFNVPDCLGKTMIGALATYNPGGSGLLTNYTANATFQGLVTGISGDPAGVVTTGLWFSSSDKPVVPGMLSQGQTGFLSSSYVVLFVVAGNGRTSGVNDGFLVMFGGNITALTGLTPGQNVPFNPNPPSSTSQQYPMLGNQDPQSLGIGNMGIFQTNAEVGAHVHSGTPDTGIAAAPGPGPLGNRGGLSATNQGAFNFTRPAYTIGSITYPAVGIAAPKTMNTLPYNLGVTMCIKT
jgi:hypothetical protein